MAIKVEVANLTNGPKYVVSPGRTGDYLTLVVSFPLLAAEGYFYGGNTLYMLEKKGDLTYRILNRTFGTMITQINMTLDTNIFDSAEIKSDKTKSITYKNGLFTIQYDASNAMKYNEVDDLYLSVAYNNFTNITNTMVLANVTVAGDTNGSVNTLYLGDNVSYITITNNDWGAVKGNVFPPFKIVYVKLYGPGSTEIKNNAFGVPLSGSSETNGTFFISRIEPGNYDIEFTAPYYKKLRVTNITTMSGLISMVSTVTLRNEALVSGNNGLQEVLCYDNTNSSVVFPDSAIDKSFSIDIKKMVLTEKQINNAKKNQSIKSPSDTNNMSGYIFEMYSLGDLVIDGSALKLDAVVTLAYDKTNDVLNRGWKESDLALYYWDDNGMEQKWVRIGGTVDTRRSIVTVKVSYLHKYYAVMSRNVGGSIDTTINNVEVRPKVLTPTSDGYFGNVRISFEFKSSVTNYEVKVYDVKGKLVRSYKRAGSYNQGEISWDAKDTEGYPVKSGVYIYRVIAKDEVYSGSIVIAR